MKNAILVLSIIGSAIAYAFFNTRDLGLCNPYCGDWVGKYQNIFVFFPILLFFSVVVYLLPPRVLKSWWKFARIATPVILLGSWVISLGLHHSPGGFFNMDNNFDLLGLMIMYAIFVVGSLIQIWRGYQSR